MTQQDLAARGWRFEPVSVACRTEKAAKRSAERVRDDHVLAYLFEGHTALTCECLLEKFEQWLRPEPPAIALGLDDDDSALGSTLANWCKPQQQKLIAGRSRLDPINHRGSGR